MFAASSGSKKVKKLRPISWGNSATDPLALIPIAQDPRGIQPGSINDGMVGEADMIIDVDSFVALDTDAKLVRLLTEISDIKRVCLNNSRRICKIYDSTTGCTIADVVAYFMKYDADGSGSIDADEFGMLLADIGQDCEETEFAMLWRTLDCVVDGAIDIREFTNICRKTSDIHPELEIEQVIKLFITQETENIRNSIMKMSMAGAEDGEGGEGSCRRDQHVHDMYPFAPYDQWPKYGSFKWMIMNLHFTMEDESYSTLSMIMFCIVMTLIFLSTLVFVLETVDSMARYPIWITFEWIVSIAFSVEFSLRLMSCRNAVRFWECETWYMNDCMNIIDLLAIIPFYLENFLNFESTVMRVVRVVRLLRVARLRRFKTIQISVGVFRTTILHSWQQSGVTIIGLLMLEILMFSSFVYVAEQGERYTKCPTAAGFEINKTTWCAKAGVPPNVGLVCDLRSICESGMSLDQDPVHSVRDKCAWNSHGECAGRYFMVGGPADGKMSTFSSIPHAMWWTISTITTTGYGEVYPVTATGQILGSITMITGVVVVSIFVVVIANNFNESNRMMQEKLRLFDKVGVTNIQDLDDYYSSLPSLPPTPDVGNAPRSGSTGSDQMKLDQPEGIGLVKRPSVTNKLSKMGASQVMPDLSVATTTTTTIITSTRVSPRVRSNNAATV